MGALQDFYDEVSAVIHRGTVHDARIPFYTGLAVRGLENYRNWQHMWHLLEAQTLLAGTSFVNVAVTAGGTLIKSLPIWRFYRYTTQAQDQAIFAYGRKVNPEKVGSKGSGARLADGKIGFWISDRNRLNLVQSFSEDVVYDIGWYEYSAVAGNDSLAWLTIDPGLLLASVMVAMAPIIRDDKITARWAPLQAAALATATESDLVHRLDGIDFNVTPYSTEVSEYLLGRGVNS